MAGLAKANIDKVYVLARKQQHLDQLKEEVSRKDDFHSDFSLNYAKLL